MDELLKETLRDFEGLGSDLPPTSRRESSSAGAASASTSSRGPSLPPKKGKGQQLAPAAPVKKHEAAGLSASAPPPHAPQLPPRTRPAAPEPPPAMPNLPPEVQKLADDLMKLMEESGVVKDEPARGLDPEDFSSSTLRSLASRAMQGRPEGPLPSGAAQRPSASSGPLEQDGEAEAFTSAALRGLAEHTKKTVDGQSKFSRGEGGPQAGRPPGAAGGPGGGGGFPFGDILGALGGGLSGADAEGGGMGFMVDYIMQNLLSKDVLYGPLKDIRDRYPPWLAANEAALSVEDLERYKAQYTSIQAVCKQYEENAGNFKQLVELIQQMQAHGDPPSEIVDEMTGGMPPGLMGGGGGIPSGTGARLSDDPDDIGNFDIPANFADLPKELQEKCAVQ